jgi:hypothetical protein
MIQNRFELYGMEFLKNGNINLKNFKIKKVKVSP